MEVARAVPLVHFAVLCYVGLLVHGKLDSDYSWAVPRGGQFFYIANASCILTLYDASCFIRW